MRFILILCLTFCSHYATSWGFHAHKSINFHAVFLLPEPLFSFFRPHIHTLRERATKADQRRYIIPSEGPKHFIDLDHYELNTPLDTIIQSYDSACKVYGIDSMVKHGMLPWNLKFCFYGLIRAFKNEDTTKVISKAADIGHYLADAHVPLHTTKNYNGQLTDQHGIHGLWESRLPELYMSSYKYYGRQARQVWNVDSLIWMVVEESYALKDQVLQDEKKLNTVFKGLKYSFETKGKTVVKVYSKEYSDAYHAILGSMVSSRMQLSIQRVADIWFTAYTIAMRKKNESMPLQPLWNNNTDSSLVKRAILH